MPPRTLPQLFRIGSKRSLRGPVPVAFETFYRSMLRYNPGKRLRSRQVAQLYGSWARQNGAQGMNAREICRAMLHIGHRLYRSNGMYFRDVQTSDAATDLPDNYPTLAFSPERQAAIEERLDAMFAELATIRAELTSPAGQA